MRDDKFIDLGVTSDVTGQAKVGMFDFSAWSKSKSKSFIRILPHRGYYEFSRYDNMMMRHKKYKNIHK